MPGDALTQSLAFDPTDPKAALSQLPHTAAVFALYGAEAHAEPYIGRTPNLRARLERLLQPSAKHPRRLQLTGRVRRIEFRLTGSEFESLLLQFEMLEKVYAAKCLERMHLGAPAFIRYLGSNAYPRITVTNRPSQREAGWAYGPFASRAAAERFADEALKLFLLRRCTDELAPRPDHPGCVYSEMKMCLAPCYQGCSDERYAEEASAVERFLATRGKSRLVQLRTERDAASVNLEFEAAAAAHAQLQRVESVRSLTTELVRPLSLLRAVVLQASANADEIAVFLYENGRLNGPQGFSMQGYLLKGHDLSRTTNDAILVAALAPQDCASSKSPDAPSLSAESIAAEAASTEGSSAADQPAKLTRAELEARMEAVLAALSAPAGSNPTLRQGHLALLKRWYYRPEVRRAGEIFFPDVEGRWPIRALLRGVGRIAAIGIKASQAE